MNETFKPNLLVDRWLEAAKRGDMAFVVDHLKRGIDVNARDTQKSTALSWDVSGRHVEPRRVGIPADPARPSGTAQAFAGSRGSDDPKSIRRLRPL